MNQHYLVAPSKEQMLAQLSGVSEYQLTRETTVFNDQEEQVGTETDFNRDSALFYFCEITPIIDTPASVSTDGNIVTPQIFDARYFVIIKCVEDVIASIPQALRTYPVPPQKAIY